MGLLGICAKTGSFSDGCVQTHLFWTGLPYRCCDNWTAQQCGCNSPSKKKLNSQPTVHALEESSWPLTSQKETPLQPACFSQVSLLCA